MGPLRKKQKLRDSNGKFVRAEEPTTPEQAQEPAYQPPGGSASERLLDTTELVESILLQLPIRDLLLATRVCRTWHGLIYGSVTLRRALFFEPVACGAISYLDWRYDDKEMYPTSLQLQLGEHVRGPKRKNRPLINPRHWGKGRGDAGEYRVFVNPLLAQMFPFLKQDGCYFKETHQDLPDAARYQLASWRLMFFTQPPVESLVLEWDSGLDPAIESEDEGEDDDEEDDEAVDLTGFVPLPNLTIPIPNATTPTLPTPALGPGNAVGTGGGGRFDDTDWTLSCFSKWAGQKGMCMEHLFFKMEELGRPAWIDGGDLWEEYRGVEDLGSVVVGEKESS